jgi:hypothetical protein
VTLAYNEHLSATQAAWWQQQAVHRGDWAMLDDARDVQIAQRRHVGRWLSEDDVMGALERSDG